MFYFYTIDLSDYSIKRIKGTELKDVTNIYLTYDDAMKAVVELIKYNKHIINNTRKAEIKKVFENEIKKLKDIK